MDDLQAGWELDGLVAEKVFGGPLVNVQWYWWRGSTPPLDIEGTIYCGPRFSTDVAAAWQVIERLDALGWWCEIKTPIEPGEPYWVGFTPHHTTGWNGHADYKDRGETMPLAVCRAALTVLEDTRKGEF